MVPERSDTTPPKDRDSVSWKAIGYYFFRLAGSCRGSVTARLCPRELAADLAIHYGTTSATAAAATMQRYADLSSCLAVGGTDLPARSECFPRPGVMDGTVRNVWPGGTHWMKLSGMCGQE